MATSTEQTLNRLRRPARLLPGLGLPLSIAGRTLGGALALAVAADQSYVRTRTFALVLAALLVLTLIPATGRWRGRLIWWGAGLAFFGGAALVHLLPGMLLLVCGVLAAAGATLDDRRTGRPLGVAEFFTPVGVLIAAITIVLLAISGS